MRHISGKLLWRDALVLTGVVVNVLAAIGHVRLLRRLERGERYRPSVSSLAVGVALVIAAFGVVMAVRLLAADS